MEEELQALKCSTPKQQTARLREGLTTGVQAPTLRALGDAGRALGAVHGRSLGRRKTAVREPEGRVREVRGGAEDCARRGRGRRGSGRTPGARGGA